MQTSNKLFVKDVEQNKLRIQLSKYVAKWPLFVICLVVCISAGLVYSRYVVPKYMAVTRFLVRENESGGKSSGDLIEVALNGKAGVNLNNEMLLVSSYALMERTVSKHGFHLRYYKKGKVLDLDIYKDAPFRLVPKKITDSSSTFAIQVIRQTDKGGHFSIGEGSEKKVYAFEWNRPFSVMGQVFELVPQEDFKPDQAVYIVAWQPVRVAANELMGNFTVKHYDTKTSVLQLTVITENQARGKDFLNALFEEFNLSDIESRDRISDHTVDFIDERLVSITNELKGVEGNLEHYQSSRQLVDVKTQSDKSLTNSNDVAKTIKNINIQQGMVKMITDYFTNTSNSTKLVPSSLGLNDGTLSSLIGEYNSLKLKREREAPLVAANSPLMQDLNSQLATLRSGILETLGNISQNLQLQERSFQQQNVQYNSFLSSLPRNERILQEIKRKQSITEGLYLYLLQKREEAAISKSAFNVANYQQIDLATGLGQVEPNGKNIILSMAILGLFLAFGIIYLKDLMNNKVLSLDDITNRIVVPVLGHVNHLPKRYRQGIAVFHRDLIGEQFRAIRTNISFLLKGSGRQAILVTSFNPGEGKSSISLNLAAVLATPGKKVALLEFDIRKPSISANLQVHTEFGITDYLGGKTEDLNNIHVVHADLPGLHIFPSGPIPANPADALLSEKMEQLYQQLRDAYDYIVTDTPPAGLLRDALLLSEYNDMVLYVIRNNFTQKDQVDAISEFNAHNAANKVGIIYNDAKASQKYGYSRYNSYFEKQRSKPIKSRKAVV